MALLDRDTHLRIEPPGPVEARLVDPGPEPVLPPPEARREKAARRSRITPAPVITLGVALFLLSMLVPPQVRFQVNGIVLWSQRVLLLLACIPSALLTLRDPNPRARWADLLLLLHCVWVVITFASNHGMDVAVKSGGIYCVEILGPYFLARAAIRNEQSFRGFAKLYVITVIASLILTVPEAFTGKHFFAVAFGESTDAGHQFVAGSRYGLTRAYGPFAHPILYGLFCAGALSLAWYTLPGQRVSFKRVVTSGLIALATGMSVSSGAIVTLGMEAGLIGWDRAFVRYKRRWKAFVVVFILGFGLLSIVASRNPFVVLSTRLSLNSDTAYTRVTIFEEGWKNVVAHPIFGLGFNDWERPGWLDSSIDNYWLLVAMRHGLPAIFLVWGAILVLVFAVLRVPLNGREKRLRIGWLICLGALTVAGCTVDFWSTTLTFYYFIVGSGAWMCRVRKERA